MWEIYLDSNEVFELKIELEKSLKIEIDGYIERYWSAGQTDMDGRSPYAISIKKTIYGPNTILCFYKKNGKIIELEKKEDINWVKSGSCELYRWGNEIGVYYRKKKAPTEKLPDLLIFEFKGFTEDKKKIFIKLPGQEETYLTNLTDVFFMDRPPTDIELRLQEMRLRQKQSDDLNDISWEYPLWYFLGDNAEKVLLPPTGQYRKFNIWDIITDKMNDYNITIDEALIALGTCIYDGGWESGNDKKDNLFHSDYFHAFTHEAQTKNFPYSKEMYYNFMIFIEKLDSAFKTVEQIRKFDNKRAQDNRKTIREIKR